ncbi:MAG TPA: YhdT family protein [Firmicutes bacterium]|nr:YhdT family protein [Bacillota bacterium]
MQLKEDPRFDQCNREAKVMVILLILNIVWWYLFAYGLGLRNPDEYTYVMGLPAWFFYSCILGYVVFSALTVIVVQVFFRDIPLDDDESAAGGAGS